MNNAYNFVICNIETNMYGKTPEICQLSAVDQSGLHCFNDYILPLRDVDIHAIRVDSLSVRTVKGARTLHVQRQSASRNCITWKVIGKFLIMFQVK